MDIQYAQKKKNEFIIHRPDLVEEVEYLWQLMLDEIEAGESVMNEVSLFLGDLDQL